MWPGHWQYIAPGTQVPSVTPPLTITNGSSLSTAQSMPTATSTLPTVPPPLPPVAPPLPPVPPPLPPVTPPLPPVAPPLSTASPTLATTTESRPATTNGSWEEEEELGGTIGRVIKDSTYEERVQMVGDILDIELPTVARKSGKFVMSLGDKELPEYKRLPPSAKYEEKFDEFIQELSAAEGSVRAKKAGGPLQVGKLPVRRRPKMQFYEIGNCPWSNSAASAQKKMVGSLVENPVGNVRFGVDRLKLCRENVSILSHQDHFVAAGMKLFQTMYECSEAGEVLDPETVWNFARQGICMMHCAALGVQDLVRNNIWQVGELVTTHRDAWLEKMKETVPATNIEQLRFTPLNTSALFSEETVNQAIEAAGERKHGKVQDRMLKITQARSEKFVKRTFREEERGQAARGRSQRGRGQGRGRGQIRKTFEKKNFNK